MPILSCAHHITNWVLSRIGLGQVGFRTAQASWLEAAVLDIGQGTGGFSTGEPRAPVKEVRGGWPNPTCLTPPQGPVGSRTLRERGSRTTLQMSRRRLRGGQV